VGREHDDRQLGVGGAHTLQHLEAAQARHLEIGEQEVGALVGQGGDGGFGVREPLHLVALAAQQHLEDRHHARLVVEHRDARDHAVPRAAFGSTSSKHAPAPCRPAPAPGAMRSSPPCARAMRSAIASPSPVPRGLVV
jgi:hypothetical protein